MVSSAGKVPVRFLLFALLLPIAIAGVPWRAAAQVVTGMLTGIVTDSTGAVLAAAKVTVVNEATSLMHTVRSNTHGEFTAASLPTGTYTVTAEAQGFKTATVSHVQLGVDQRIRVDLKLEIGT